MTNNLTSVTKYKNSDRANFQAWRRTLSAALSTHSEKLLTIVTDKELAKSVLIKYKDADASDLEIIRDEADTAAWHIFVASIEDQTSNSGHVDCGNQILVDETNEDMTTRMLARLSEESNRR